MFTGKMTESVGGRTKESLDTGGVERGLWISQSENVES